MAEYTLMNKNHPVVSFRYDRDIHAVVKIVDVHDLRYAPVALADSKGIVTRRALNDWWRGVRFQRPGIRFSNFSIL